MMRWADKNKRIHLRGEYELTDVWKDELKMVLKYERITEEKMGVVSRVAMVHMNKLYDKYKS